MMTVDGEPGANGWSNESEGVVEWSFCDSEQLVASRELEIELLGQCAS
jgi:hypothetical protein